MPEEELDDEETEDYGMEDSELEEDRIDDDYEDDFQESGPRTTYKQRSRRVCSFDIPHNTKGHWTSEEDQLLHDAVKSNGGKNWKKIAEALPGRTDV